MTIDCEEFHNLMMDYRAASIENAQIAYQKVLDYIDNWCDIITEGYEDKYR